VCEYSKEWEVDEVDMQLLMSEISGSKVGLKGNRFFTITYSLLGNVKTFKLRRMEKLFVIFG